MQVKTAQLHVRAAFHIDLSFLGPFQFLDRSKRVIIDQLQHIVRHTPAPFTMQAAGPPRWGEGVPAASATREEDNSDGGFTMPTRPAPRLNPC